MSGSRSIGDRFERHREIEDGITREMIQSALDAFLRLYPGSGAIENWEEFAQTVLSKVYVAMELARAQPSPPKSKRAREAFG